MKIRKDFVTNSSSSSFIISTDKEIPKKYERHIQPLTEELLGEHLGNDWSVNGTLCYSQETDDLLKEVANLTDEQMNLICLAVNGNLQSYLDIKEEMRKAELENKTLYNIYVDRDWLYDEDDLRAFINNSEVIDEEGDL